MKKKLAAVLLMSSLVTGLLAGCANTSQEPAATSAEPQEQPAVQESAAPEEAGELTTIYWQFPTDGGVSEEGLSDVEARYNEMLAENGIPAKIEFVSTTLMDAQQDAVLMVSAGEQLDIMLTAFTSIDSLVGSNLILPLDDIIYENAPDAMEKSYSATKCLYKGHLYGITTGDVDYQGPAYFLKTSFLDKYGIEIDPDKFYTMDEIEEILTVIDEGEGPGNTLFTVPWQDYEPGNRQYFALGEPSGSLSGGCINFSEVGFQDPTIVDLFETDAYAEYAQRMYEWAQKGWIAADAAVSTMTPDEGILLDNCAGEFYWGGVTAEKDLESSTSIDWTRLRLADYYRDSLGTAVIMWNIPSTTADAGLALQVLNLLYKDVNAATLIQRGREGIEWEATEVAEDGTIEQIKLLNENVTDGEYYQYYGIYGNTLDWPGVYPAGREDVELKAAADQSVPEDRIFIGGGYTFVSESVSAEIAAVETVISQYASVVNCGAADPDVVLPEFIDALKASGIDAIIAENQKQLDEYIAQKQ